MTGKLTKSAYIRISKIIIRKLYKEGCWGKGSMYEDNLKNGFSPEDELFVMEVANALVKQNILGKKRKLHGFKYYLNPERRDKINEIRE